MNIKNPIMKLTPLNITINPDNIYPKPDKFLNSVTNNIVEIHNNINSNKKIS